MEGGARARRRGALTGPRAPQLPLAQRRTARETTVSANRFALGSLSPQSLSGSTGWKWDRWTLRVLAAATTACVSCLRRITGSAEFPRSPAELDGTQRYRAGRFVTRQ